MKATEMLHSLGQSIWLDNITRELLDTGRLKDYINDLALTGLTSNPTIFDHAITHSASYDSEIRKLMGAGLSGEALFFELALRDLTRAADLFLLLTNVLQARMAGYRLRSHRYLHTTPRPRSNRPQHFTKRPTGPTCSSRFRVPGKEVRRSKRQSFRACR
jgi:hypothetical protein